MSGTQPPSALTEEPASQSPHATGHRIDHSQLPPLFEDPAFFGMTITQFLGALNDSIFKQVVLLIMAMVAVTQGAETTDQQFLGQGLFAIAFVLFSGVAGYWSDKTSKRAIIIGAKVGEIVVMLGALLAFWFMPPRVPSPDGAGSITLGIPWGVLFVLFLMGTQSAIFGPAKYGILPEMVRGDDLPRFNGMIQMTTFLALIFGTYLGGLLLREFREALWAPATICVGIAVAGTISSFWVRRTPVAQPDAHFHLSALAVAPDTWNVLKRDRSLQGALLVYSVFWGVAALIPMAVNSLGLNTFKVDEAETSFLLTWVSVGIAGGFMLAGKLSSGTVRFGLVRIGTVGLMVCLVAMSLPAGRTLIPLEGIGAACGVSGATLPPMQHNHLLGYVGSQFALAVSGFFAGLFALPVQVFLQAKPPEHIKGRMIGTMNLINWIAIIASALLYPNAQILLGSLDLAPYWIFAAMSVLLLPIAIFYRPADYQLRE